MKTTLAVFTWALALFITSGCSKGSLKSVTYHFFESLKNEDKEPLESLFITESEFVEKIRSSKRDSIYYQKVSDAEIKSHYQEIKSKFFNEIEKIIKQIRLNGGWSNAELDVVSVSRRIDSFEALINFRKPEETFSIRLDSILASNQRWISTPHVRIVVSSNEPKKVTQGQTWPKSPQRKHQ